MPRSIAMTGLIAAALLAISPAASCTSAAPRATDAPPNAAVAEAPLAHPVVEGTAGPFARARVTLTRTSPAMGAPFVGKLQAGTAALTLVGPDEPADFFIVDPKSVLFIPLGTSGPNGVVILYDSSQIGPDHGTEHRALVYRIEQTRAVRQPALETRLEGASTAAEARRRLTRSAP